MNPKPYKLDKYLDYFKGREDYIAVQGTHYYPIKQSLDSYVVSKHIDGIKTFGVYVLTKASKCNFICIDIDIEKKELSQVNFSDPIVKFEYLSSQILKFQDIFENFLFKPENILYEDSGGRGYHIWVFFDSPIDGSDALYLNDILKSKIDSLFDFEFFPKQHTLNEKRRFGNLIKLPLGEHKKYNQRSKFFTIENNEIQYIEGIDNNLAHIEKIVKVNNDELQRIIESYRSTIKYDTRLLIEEKIEPSKRKLYIKNLYRLYGQCNAIRELKYRAEKGEVLNHSELSNLSNTLLSLKDSKDDIHSLIRLSLKKNYSYKIARKELVFLEKLQPPSCKTLIKNGICKRYCKSEFQKRNEDNSLHNTSPLHSQTPLLESKKNPSTNLTEDICKHENIRLAYYRLREYHKKEDALFYDEFDFEFFEKDFDTNIHLVSQMIKNEIEIPSINYEKVPIPKKLDKDGNMINRQMAYSSVFDQIFAQSIFNVIGEILESNFEDSSYGYRLNINKNNSYNIFEDWREKYPAFRNTVLNNLREPNIKYYICCDIKGYYDNIKKDILLSQIRSVIHNKYIVSLIENIVNSYSFDEEFELGLPQGPAYARALANLYLNDFDKEINEKANYYFRYVDDFYVLFDSLEKANKVKEWIVNRLEEIGLQLSDDPNKKPDIIVASDETHLQKKIDSVRYGIFEDFKFLPNLSKQNIADFYDTIIEAAYDANDKNQEIPTLIYFGTTPNIDKERQEIIINIVEELAREEKFYPKKVKNLFSRLIEIYKDLNRDFIPFYQLLNPINKTYFLIAVYEKYKLDESYYLEKIKQIVTLSKSSKNQFLLGIALNISFTNPKINSIVVDKDLIAKANGYSSQFLLSKLLWPLDYFNLSSDVQVEIDKCLDSSTNFIVKKSFLTGIKETGTIKEIDKILFKKILSDNYCFIHLECCRIISHIKVSSNFFDTLVKFIEKEKSKYGILIINLLGKELLEVYQRSDSRDLDNLISLFNQQPNEIKNVANEVSRRVQKTYGNTLTSYSEGYNRLDIYDGSSYYVSYDDNEVYREIIPHLVQNQYQIIGEQIRGLIEESIIPPTTHEYNSTNNEIILNSKIPFSYKNISELHFSLEDNKDCYNLLNLINNLYKKSRRYYEITNKIPYIENNVKVNEGTFDVIFTNKGKDIPSQYICNAEKIDSNNPENITSLIYYYIFNNLFKTISEFNKYSNTQESPKLGLQLFTEYIIKRFKSKNISVEKVDYLFQLLKKETINDNTIISYLFFSEKLKSNVFKNCEQFINWKGITNGTIELYKDFAITYGKIDFPNISYKNGLFLNNEFPYSLFNLSKNILNINFNLDELFGEINNRLHFNYFQLLNIFGVYCIEIQSLFKVILIDKQEIDFLSTQTRSIEYDEVKMTLYPEEVIRINHLIKVYNSPYNSVFDHSVNYSLKEMGVLCLIIYFGYSGTRNYIKLHIKNKKKDQILADLLIYHNYNIEYKIYNIISLFNSALINHYREPEVSIEQIINEKETLIKHLFLIRKTSRKQGIKRSKCKYHKKNYKKNFELSTRFSKVKKVPDSMTCNNPFTSANNNFERDGELWYESKKGRIFNLIIPDKRIYTLYKKLKKGKLFGYKFSLYYHNKGLLLWDIVIISSLFVVYTYILSWVLSETSISFWSNMTLIPSSFIFAKIFLVDLSYWYKSVPNLIKSFNRKNN